jgi:hypothetical protein
VPIVNFIKIFGLGKIHRVFLGFRNSKGHYPYKGALACSQGRHERNFSLAPRYCSSL